MHVHVHQKVSRTLTLTHTHRRLICEIRLFHLRNWPLLRLSKVRDLLYKPSHERSINHMSFIWRWAHFHYSHAERLSVIHDFVYGLMRSRRGAAALHVVLTCNRHTFQSEHISWFNTGSGHVILMKWGIKLTFCRFLEWTPHCWSLMIPEEGEDDNRCQTDFSQRTL